MPAVKFRFLNTRKFTMRMLRAKFPNDEGEKARHRHAPRTSVIQSDAKPILLLALVQNDLQRAKPDRQQAEPDESTSLDFAFLM